MADHQGHLGAVYAAQTPDDIARTYDAWAETYEAEMARAGYRHPAIATALLTRHLPRGAAPVLDAGAGTGLAGEWLNLLGYPQVEALDISAGMLAVAARKGAYTALHRAALGQPLPFPDAHFAAVIATGVFTTGHVGAEALPELLRITRPGAVLVLTVKLTLWEAGFADALAPLAQLDRTAPYVSMPGETATSPSLAVAVRR